MQKKAFHALIHLRVMCIVSVLSIKWIELWTLKSRGMLKTCFGVNVHDYNVH